jgi:hypothetical protein
LSDCEALPRIRDYPRAIWVDGQRWRVVFKSPVIFDGEHVRGRAVKADRLVEVDSKQDPRLRLRTFIHEALHALEFEYGFKLRHQSILDLEEPIVDLLVDNWPWVFEVLRAKKARRPSRQPSTSRPRSPRPGKSSA